MGGKNFATEFFTGMANQLNTDISARYAKADEFFEEQVKLARTKGLENRTRVQQQVGQYTSLAKQLQQIGVPKQVIMAVANQDPASLEGFAETVNKARGSGVELNEEFFGDLVEMSRDFKAPDEDYETFFRRVFEPIALNAQADPEAFKRDRKGSIWATLMGHNAMDRAQTRLGETEIIDGLSAEQLLRYGDSGLPNKPYGDDLTVTLNPNAIPKNNDLSLSDLKFIGGEVDTAIGKARNELANTGDYNLNTPEGKSTFDAAVNAAVLAQLENAYGDRPEVMAEIYKRLGISPREVDDTIEESAIPPSKTELEEVGIDGAPEAAPGAEPVAPTTEAPAPETVDPAMAAPIDVEKEPALRSIALDGNMYEYQGAYDETSSLYKVRPLSGKATNSYTVRLLNSEVRQIAKGE